MAMSSGGGGDLNSEINVTPLVDVMLVLLVIFMITAPMMTTGVKLDLPQGNVSNVEDDEGKLVLSIDADQHVYLGKTPVKWSELESKLSSNARVQKERTLYIEADKSLPYGVVVAAMDSAQTAGVDKLLMRTDPITDEAKKALYELDETAPDGADEGAKDSP
jgi:biopolymer transport protein TolR